MIKKMVDLWVKHNESVRETHEEDNEQSKMLERKLKFFKKKTIPKAQNTRFLQLN